LPTEDDQPNENFFFAAGTSGGRLRFDLRHIKTIQQIDTYSWHSGARGPQVYKLYGASGTNADFNPSPKHGIAPPGCGWTFIASVDTRRTNREPGGQYGASISNPDSTVGNYRYLLFDCSPTETNDAFGNTFYSEINVVGPGDDTARVSSGATAADIKPYVAQTPDGKYEFTIDTSRATNLTQWATNQLASALLEWYPKIVAFLPSENFEAPRKFSIILRPGRGVAATSGTRITANANWIKRELKGQAIGSLIHEAVHVVQDYGYGRHHNPNPAENPGYLVEGIADYIRWYKFEPQSKGAEISERGLSRANYDNSYRVTANFLNWVTEKYNYELVPQLNAAMRNANYNTNIWTKTTGKTVEQLNAEWKESLKEHHRQNPAASDKNNS
jgi:hypothetical protein